MNGQVQGRRARLSATLTASLKEYAQDIGIDRLGVSDAREFVAEKSRLEEAEKDGTYPPFTERDIDLRCRPERILPGARSIISVALSYLTDDEAHPSMPDGLPRAWVSRYAWGDTDYHHILREKLELLIAFLSERAGHPVEARPFVDTGPPIDRAVAARAGVGWFGKNNCVYVPGLGSWVFLAEIVTNVVLDPDTPVSDDCGSCTRCITACPTGAITGPFRIDPYRCLSYITQMPGVIPREFRRPMGRMLFGCDICQVVCPWNWDAQATNRSEFRPQATLGPRPELIPLLSMTKSEFKRWFGNTAMGWRGKKTIQRNACICLGNIKNPVAVEPLCERLVQDPKEEVRGAAAWALGEIGGPRAAQALAERLPKEPSPYVASEIEEALKTLATAARSLR